MKKKLEGGKLEEELISLIMLTILVSSSCFEPSISFLCFFFTFTI